MIMVTKLAGLVLALCAVRARADCPEACTNTDKCGPCPSMIGFCCTSPGLGNFFCESDPPQSQDSCAKQFPGETVFDW